MPSTLGKSILKYRKKQKEKKAKKNSRVKFGKK